LSDEWGTPQRLFDILNDEFHFTVDVCASDDNHKCPIFLTKKENGLNQNWTGVCWMNPPYGREIVKWMKKACDSAEAGATVVCLIPARTSPPWWHDYALRGSELRFIRTKVSFEGPVNGVPFWGSVVVVFRKGDHSCRVSSQRQK
jgi:phage N-6-adenine-methyltransferase